MSRFGLTPTAGAFFGGQQLFRDARDASDRRKYHEQSLEQQQQYFNLRMAQHQMALEEMQTQALSQQAATRLNAMRLTHAFGGVPMDPGFLDAFGQSPLSVQERVIAEQTERVDLLRRQEMARKEAERKEQEFSATMDWLRKQFGADSNEQIGDLLSVIEADKRAELGLTGTERAAIAGLGGGGGATSPDAFRVGNIVNDINQSYELERRALADENNAGYEDDIRQNFRRQREGMRSTLRAAGVPQDQIPSEPEAAVNPTAGEEQNERVSLAAALMELNPSADDAATRAMAEAARAVREYVRQTPEYLRGEWQPTVENWKALMQRAMAGQPLGAASPIPVDRAGFARPLPQSDPTTDELIRTIRSLSGGG